MIQIRVATQGWIIPVDDIASMIEKLIKVLRIGGMILTEQNGCSVGEKACPSATLFTLILWAP